MSQGSPLHSLESVSTVQTSVELFNQLQRQRASDADLGKIRAAYGMAMQLFAGRMHACGKPYLCHCLGVAGVLAGLGVSTDLVVAGLLHGAYRWGDFGSWRVFRSAKRRRLARDFGTTVEAYVYRFETLPWKAEAVRGVRDQLETLEADTRGAVLMRLVSDLDNARDGALLFCADADRRRESMAVTGPIMAEIAAGLGFPALSRALTTAVADTAKDDVPAELRWHLPAGALLLPASTHRKGEATLAAMMGAGLRRVRHARGRSIR